MRSFFVVVSTPCLAFCHRVGEAHEPVGVQAFRPELAVEALDERIVGRLSGPAEVERHALHVGPKIKFPGYELTALIHPDAARIADLGADPLQHFDDIQRPEPEPRHHRRSIAAGRVDDGQDAQLRACRQLVVHKVHRPGLVRLRCRAAAFSQLGFHPAPGRFAPQLQPHLFVKPIDALSVHIPTLPAQQDMDPAIAVSNPRLRDLLDPLLQVGLIGAAALVVVAGSFGPQNTAGPPDAHLPRGPNFIHQLPSPSRPQSFRETTSCNIALSSDRSATRRLSLAFSSSSWRSRFISDGIKPAYFFRQL